MHEAKTDKTEKKLINPEFQLKILTLFSVANRTSIQKFSKDREQSNTIHLLGLIDIQRHYSKISEYLFLKCLGGAYTNIDNSLGHKLKLKKCKKIQIMLSIFSDLLELKLDNNNIKVTWKSPNT